MQLASAIIGKEADRGNRVWIGDLERRSGLYLLGKSGMGKTVLMVNLLDQDLQHWHGVFFLDPHGDAIRDLLHHGDLGGRSDIYLFDIQDEHNSFGVNLLACDDLTNLRSREMTYNHAFGVFARLWGHEFVDRPWLRLIIQHTLRAFLETPGLTLAEVPLFLDPANHAFRSYVVRNMTANAPVADFWLNQFAAKKSDDQQRQVDAARTRVQELLADPYVRDIVGQPDTTLAFDAAMERGQVLLFTLPQTLAPDTKRFIGTILLSELLLAVQARDLIPADERHQFCIYVDEVQHFAHSDDFTTLFTEARKYSIATTIAHQERYGQFADRKKMAGATAAAANKVFFQTTVMDAQELAAEFADIAEETELKEEASTVLSPHVLEDLWDKGHPDPWIMHYRNRYFWIVDAFRSSRPETDVLCRPAKQAGLEDDFSRLAMQTGLSREKAAALRNPGALHIEAFTDWELYRSSREMLADGIAALNTYFFEAMQGHRDHKPETMLFILQCVGGVYGFRPVMEPYIPDDMRVLYIRRDKEHKDHMARDYETEWWRTRVRDGANTASLDRALKAAGYLEEESLKNIPGRLLYFVVSQWRSFASTRGFTQHELNEFIRWQIRTLSIDEQRALYELVDTTVRYDRSDAGRILRQYTGVMMNHTLENMSKEAEDISEIDLRIIQDRAAWQATALQYFIVHIRGCAELLAKQPLQRTSGHFTKRFVSERTQGELVDIMAQRLINLPRFNVYAKVMREGEGGQQEVWKGRVETFPLPASANDDFTAITGRSRVAAASLRAIERTKFRRDIQDAIRERQARWLGMGQGRGFQGTPEPPPSSYYKAGQATERQQPRMGSDSQAPPPASNRVVRPPSTAAPPPPSSSSTGHAGKARGSHSIPTRFCSQCGIDLPAMATYCTHCGRRIGQHR